MKAFTLQQRLAELLDGQLGPLGFRHRRFSWFRSGAELYSVCSLQKSTWGDDGCYINLGFSPSDQAVNAWLAESRCWLRFRAEALRLLSAEDLRLVAADAIETMGEQNWVAEVADRVVRPIVDILVAPDNLQSLAAMLRSEVSEEVFIHQRLRQFLEPDAAAGSTS